MGLPELYRVAPPWVLPRPATRYRRRVGLVVAAWWRASELDRQLGAGTSAILAVRAETLTSQGSRRRLADGLARALRSARDTTPALSAAVRPRAREVLATRTVLAVLDHRLRAPEPVAARGMAMLQGLLTDAASQLYQPGNPGALGSRLRAAAAALEPRDEWH
jgi:hypothetical protein